MERQQTLDIMCIPIKKVSEDNEIVEYQFAVDIYEPDPKRNGRFTIVGEAQGVFCLDKKSGEINLLDKMPGDKNNKRFLRASKCIQRHWEKGDYPDSTMFACG